MHSGKYRMLVTLYLAGSSGALVGYTGFKETKNKCFFPAHSHRFSVVSLCNSKIECPISYWQDSNVKFCVGLWRIEESSVLLSGAHSWGNKKQVHRSKFDACWRRIGYISWSKIFHGANTAHQAHKNYRKGQEVFSIG